jgi:hypothetical protein
VEIDPLCIPSFDRSCLRFVIALQHPCVSSRVAVQPPSGRGIVLRQEGVSFWPLEQQFNEAGDWIPFYGPPPPPPGSGGPGHLPAPPPKSESASQQQPPPPRSPSPAPQGRQDHPAVSLGVSILCFGFINTFPLPKLPALPVILHVFGSAPRAPRGCSALPVLLLTWRSPEDAPAVTPPPF